MFPQPKNLLPLDLHGGFSDYNRSSLEEIFNKNEIFSAIEIGSWLGLSSVFLASKVKDKLYCIDPWEIQVEQKMVESWAQYENKLFDQFLSNIIHLKLESKIIPLKGFSHQILPDFNQKVDLIFIDGSHKYENVKFDIINSLKLLKPNGIICGDDWGIPLSNISEGVVRAVEEVAYELNRPIYSNNTFWRIM